LFETAAESERNDGNPAAGVGVPLWGWVEREAELSKGSNGISAARRTATLNKELWSGDGKGSMVVNVKGKGVNLDFTIIKRLQNGSITFDAECAGDSHESRAISNSVALREPLNDLGLLLVS
jgi:hypothetical protein